MVKLTHTGTSTISLFKPMGAPESLIVEPGQSVEVPGKLIDPQPDGDAILIDIGGELRAYSKDFWRVPKQSAADVKAAKSS